MTSALTRPIVLRVVVVESPLLQTCGPGTNSSLSRILELPLQGDAGYINGLFLIAKAVNSHNPVFKELQEPLVREADYTLRWIGEVGSMAVPNHKQIG